jgi:TPR repeat protein
MPSVNRFWSAPGSRRPLLLAGLMTALLAASGVAQIQSANAQSGNAEAGAGAAIDLAAEIQAAPGVETAVPLAIQTRGGTDNLIMLIRGLPGDVTISEGRVFGQGVWAVPLASANRLKLRTAASAGGISQISVAVVTRDGAKLAEATTVLRIAPRQQPQIAAQQQTASVQPRAVGRPDAAGQSANAPAPARLTPADEQQLGRLILKANENMQTGKVAAARLLYQRAAESGSATAALALASTYDANELARWNIVGGVHADAKLARQWYGKAKELGSAEAAQRLQRLGER